MPEFMFRNLSVKVYPFEGGNRLACQDWTTQVINCGPCTQFPATYVQVCPNLCTQTPSIPIYCDPQSAGPFNVDTHTVTVSPTSGNELEELAVLKDHLQKSMAAVDARQVELQNAARPTSVEQIDDLKSQLLAAVAELDEQRAQLEGGGQAPAAG
jgi:hypothetical protein